MAVELATAYVSLVPSTSKLAPGVRGVLDRTMPKEGTRAGSKLGGFLSSAVKKTALAGMVAVGAATGAALLSGVKSAVNIQQSKKTLAGLYGSVDQANSSLALLRKTASRSPIDYQAFTKGAEQLAYMGYKGKDANAILSNVGKAVVAVGGSSEDMGRVTTAMLQMQNSGKVYSDQLNQISQAGVPIFSGLAAHFGTNIKNVREMVTKGKVGIEDVMAVVRNAEGKTFKQTIAASEGATKSLANQWKIAKDNLATTLGFMFQPGVDALGKFVTQANVHIQKLPQYMAKAKTAISAVFASAPVQSIVGSFKSLGTSAASLVTPLGQVAKAMAPFAKAAIAVAIGAIVAAFKVLAVVGRVVAAVLGAVGRFAENHTTTFRVLAGVVLVAVAAWKAYRLTVAGIAAVQRIMAAQLVTTRIGLVALRVQTVAVSVAQRAAAVATKAFAIGQRILNAAMRANPIGLVITVLGLLVGAVILAYKRSSTFRAIVQAAFRGVAAIGKWMWANVLKPTFAALRVALRAIGTAASWLWRKAIQPAFRGIALVVRAQIAVAKVVLRTLSTMFRAVGNAGLWLYRKAIAPAIRGVRTVISSAWNGGIRPVLSALANFIRHTVPAAFRAGVAAIKAAWGKVKAAAKAPVNFMIGTVYGKGIKGLFDKVASAVGAKVRLPSIPLLASGTESLTKASKAGWRRRPTAIVGEGSSVHPESVIPTDPKHRGRALKLWQETGARLGMPMMAGGGFLGALKSKVAKLVDVATNPLGAFKKLAAGPIGWMKRFAGNDFGRLVAGVPRKILDLVVTKVKSILGGSGNTAAIIRAAKAANGSPYVWGGASLSGSDCSGFQSILYRAGLGKKPLGQREFTTSTFAGGRNVGSFKRGLKSPYQVSVNPGSHIWGKVQDGNGKWYAVESGGPWGKVHFGGASGIRGGGQYHYGLQFKKMARGGTLDPSMYPFPLEGMPEPMLRKVLAAQAKRLPVYDRGGMLQPGPMNRTRRPEPVLTDQQWSDVKAYLPIASDRTAPTPRSAPLIGENHIHEATNSQQTANDLAFTLRSVGRGGRHATQTR